MALAVFLESFSLSRDYPLLDLLDFYPALIYKQLKVANILKLLPISPTFTILCGGLPREKVTG